MFRNFKINSSKDYHLSFIMAKLIDFWNQYNEQNANVLNI